MNSILARLRNPLVLLGVALALAATTGVLTATAFGVGQQAPAVTTTINVATGPQGATGPPGAPGAESCPAGSKFGKLVINHPGGQTSILTCIVG